MLTKPSFPPDTTVVGSTKFTQPAPALCGGSERKGAYPTFLEPNLQTWKVWHEIIALSALQPRKREVEEKSQYSRFQNILKFQREIIKTKHASDAYLYITAPEGGCHVSGLPMCRDTIHKRRVDNVQTWKYMRYCHSFIFTKFSIFCRINIVKNKKRPSKSEQLHSVLSGRV